MADALLPQSSETIDCREDRGEASALATEPLTAGAMLGQLVDRLFLRALQILLAGVLFGIAFFPVRGRGAPLDIVTAAVLLGLAVAALRRRRALLAALRRHPGATILFPLPALLAVTLDGGFDSVWTPLVAITVGVPATLGLPWLSCGCAVLAASGQAAAAWLNRADKPPEQVVETALFNAVGTIAVGVGIALSVATMAGFLRGRAEILAGLRDRGAAAPMSPASADPQEPAEQRRLPPPRRTPLTPAELRVVALLAAGRAPKQISGDLNVAVSTVRSHLKAAKRKTQTRTLTELVGLFVTQDGAL